jgi:CMD domain protein
MSDAADVIDRLAGIAVGSPLEAIRAQRPVARANAQASFRALFQPAETGDMSLVERHAVALFVAGLHRQPVFVAFFAARLADAAGAPALASAIETEIALGATDGPYGRFPPGPLSVEDQRGLTYHVAAANRAALGARLSVAFAHAHLLVFRPREAGPQALQTLLDAGWSTAGIVTLSQLVSFLAFQIRVVAGLRSLAASPAGSA